MIHVRFHWMFESSRTEQTEFDFAHENVTRKLVVSNENFLVASRDVVLKILTSGLSAKTPFVKFRFGGVQNTTPAV